MNIAKGLFLLLLYIIYYLYGVMLVSEIEMSENPSGNAAIEIFTKLSHDIDCICFLHYIYLNLLDSTCLDPHDFHSTIFSAISPRGFRAVMYTDFPRILFARIPRVILAEIRRIRVSA